ncbi:pentatricopeptide repeat-containing protein At5g66520-like [Amborella trichopoda]|uniref:pentatricopeptide repeat-containing protein At5g66520-like n=1 Tax=Amborella trichopoda TaxID=13333 RepID=UPI0009BDFA6A|nr:pentatricopeptide repeat-containing protein At5g66520-like [Amborella trichopoda]|eukprot:XP_011620923.2 pentatricopeptide repeat-containing protein At5g66520-like [Amborella trichopoda]
MRLCAALERETMSLLQSSTTLKDLHQIHSFMVKTSLDHNNFLVAKLLACSSSLSSPSNSMVYTQSIFDIIESPDTFIYNTMIRSHLNFHNSQEPISLFDEMLRRNMQFDNYTFSMVLQACGRSPSLRQGERIHTQFVKSGFAWDLFVKTELMIMYLKCGELKRAQCVFDEMGERDLVAYNALLAELLRMGALGLAQKLFNDMPVRDLVSWNTMIHGYAQNGDTDSARCMFDSSSNKDLVSWSSMIAGYTRTRRPNDALRLFYDMQLANVKPDKITVVSVLSACGDLGAINTGIMIHEYVNKHGIELDVKLGTALIDMYAKCGSIENSLRVFEKMVGRDVLAWSAMIIGLANHGLAKRALCLFSSMIARGIEPYDITFVGILTACSYTGMVDTGKQVFQAMNEVYKISPKIEHYGCMVDLLGRGGLLNEAKELIESMPIDPDAIVWRTLLGACRIHKNVSLAEEAAKKLIELEPRADGNYVLLSNIYAQENRWDEVSRVRRLIKEKGIQRVPGSSSIEVDNSVHEFVVGDRSHTMSKEIYGMLGEISRELREAGYVPNTSFILQDVDEKVKEEALEAHSEKLAIAFGLLSTAPRCTIRIVKNLRICEDCHSWIKLVSKIYYRDIIVRDRNRFHHFVKGFCSCRDYW